MNKATPVPSVRKRKCGAFKLIILVYKFKDICDLKKNLGEQSLIVDNSVNSGYVVDRFLSLE